MPEALGFNMANKAGKGPNPTLSAFNKNDFDFAILINVKLTPQNSKLPLLGLNTTRSINQKCFTGLLNCNQLQC